MLWIKTGAISSFFTVTAVIQRSIRWKRFKKTNATQPPCVQASESLPLPWVTARWCDLAAHLIPSALWLKRKKKKEMGHCTMTKGQSLDIQQLRKVWAPVASNAQRKLVLAVCGCQRQTDRQTKQHRLHQPSTGDMFNNPTRQKEVAESHWWRGREGWRRGCLLHY